MSATADPDEEATTWAGETDPSHVAAPQPVVERVDTDTGAPARPPMSSMLLIVYGVLGGIHLIYTVGWIISVQRLNAARVGSSELLSEIMFQLGEFLAMASPAIWVAAAVLLTRGRKPILRLLWLFVGLVAVLPWPFVLGAWL